MTAHFSVGNTACMALQRCTRPACALASSQYICLQLATSHTHSRLHAQMLGCPVLTGMTAAAQDGQRSTPASIGSVCARLAAGARTRVQQHAGDAVDLQVDGQRLCDCARPSRLLRACTHGCNRQKGDKLVMDECLLFLSSRSGACCTCGAFAAAPVPCYELRGAACKPVPRAAEDGEACPPKQRGGAGERCGVMPSATDV